MQGPVILSDYPVLEGEEAVAQALATAEELLGQDRRQGGRGKPLSVHSWCMLRCTACQ